MKKYLMTGIAALAMGGMFTSCTQDMSIYSGSQADYVKQSYEQKFIQAFGEPAPNQTWGFGSETATVAATRGMTRTIQPSYSFPADADASKFLSEVPEGVKTYDEVGQWGYASGTSYIENRNTEVNIWGGWDGSKTSGGTLYIKGNCDFSNVKFYVAPNTEVYLLEGATLTLNNENAGNLQSGCNYYLAANSKIVTSGELKLNNGLHIFNHGTIEANKLSTNSNSWLVNGGTVTIATKISVENELSVIENNNTITAADLNTAGSGKFENNADVTISGTTFINSNNNTWVNNGQYHTGNFIYNAGSDDVINNCRLTVDEDFNINLGDNPGNGNFKMDAGAGVVTKYFNGGGNWAKNYSTGWSSFNGGPFYIYMGANSVFKVTETATMNATKADYGIYGPSDGGYAVFQAKNIVAGAANQGYEVTYGGNLYVSADSHFANGYSGQYPYIDIKGNAKIYAPGFESGKPAISISETACNPGFKGINTVDIRIIAEDLTVNGNSTDNTDFDFNDIVFDVKWDKDNNKVYVKFLAAGGELPIFIGNDGDVEPWELHQLFKEANDGKNISTKTMMNTYAGQHNAYSCPEKELPSGWWSGSDIKTIAKSIKIRVKKSSVPEAIVLEAPEGKVPSKIAVGTDYEWCDERKAIDEKYSGNFTEYVAGHLEWNKWYK